MHVNEKELKNVRMFLHFQESLHSIDSLRYISPKADAQPDSLTSVELSLSVRKKEKEINCIFTKKMNKYEIDNHYKITSFHFTICK